MKIDGYNIQVSIEWILTRLITDLGTNSAHQKEWEHRNKEWPYCQQGEALRDIWPTVPQRIRTKSVPLPWTMLAGCGKVCIRRTAHKST